MVCYVCGIIIHAAIRIFLHFMYVARDIPVDTICTASIYRESIKVFQGTVSLLYKSRHIIIAKTT